jgi:hypothetical protein
MESYFLHSQNKKKLLQLADKAFVGNMAMQHSIFVVLQGVQG